MIIKSISDFQTNLKVYLDEAAKESVSDVPFDVATIILSKDVKGHSYVLYALNHYEGEDVLKVFDKLDDFFDYLNTIMKLNNLSFDDIRCAGEGLNN